METKYWETLRVVAELGSFSRAAERLHITQSAVSRRVALLEDHYGVPLLDRSKGAVTPSTAGHYVIESSRRILALEHEIEAFAARARGTGRVSLGCTSSFAATYLPALLDRAGSEVHLTITLDTTGALLEAFEEGRLDVAVFEHCDLSGLPGELRLELPRDEVVFVTPSGQATGEVPGVLFSRTLYCSASSCCTRVLLEQNLSRVGHGITSFARVVELGDTHVLRSSLADPKSVAFVSRALVASDIRAGVLQEHRVPGFEHERMRSVLARDALLLEQWHGMLMQIIKTESAKSGLAHLSGCSCDSPDEPSAALLPGSTPGP